MYAPSALAVVAEYYRTKVSKKYLFSKKIKILYMSLEVSIKLIKNLR